MIHIAQTWWRKIQTLRLSNEQDKHNSELGK